MTTVNIYLTFDGNCKEAFNFYKSIFQREFSSISTFGEMPPQEGMPPISDDMKERIMHVTLPVSKETLLMGSDSGGWGPPITQGNNFSISIFPSSREEGDRIFNALSKGGDIKMAMEETFWDAYFGMVTDQFGINWMVNFTLSEES